MSPRSRSTTAARSSAYPLAMPPRPIFMPASGRRSGAGRLVELHPPVVDEGGAGGDLVRRRHHRLGGPEVPETPERRPGDVEGAAGQLADLEAPPDHVQQLRRHGDRRAAGLAVDLGKRRALLPFAHLRVDPPEDVEHHLRVRLGVRAGGHGGPDGGGHGLGFEGLEGGVPTGGRCRLGRWAHRSAGAAHHEGQDEEARGEGDAEEGNTEAAAHDGRRYQRGPGEVSGRGGGGRCGHSSPRGGRGRRCVRASQAKSSVSGPNTGFCWIEPPPSGNTPSRTNGSPSISRKSAVTVAPAASK